MVGVSTATNPEVERLGSSSYLSLTTFRQDGTAVPTPGWGSSDGRRLFVWTEATSGKVRRIRNRGHVVVAPCDARGSVLGGSVDASARILDDPADIGAVEALHRAKYGLQFRLFRVFGQVARRGRGMVAIELTVV